MGTQFLSLSRSARTSFFDSGGRTGQLAPLLFFPSSFRFIPVTGVCWYWEPLDVSPVAFKLTGPISPGMPVPRILPCVNPPGGLFPRFPVDRSVDGERRSSPERLLINQSFYARAPPSLCFLKNLLLGVFGIKTCDVSGCTGEAPIFLCPYSAPPPRPAAVRDLLDVRNCLLFSSRDCKVSSVRFGGGPPS